MISTLVICKIRQYKKAEAVNNKAKKEMDEPASGEESSQGKYLNDILQVRVFNLK